MLNDCDKSSDNIFNLHYHHFISILSYEYNADFIDGYTIFNSIQVDLIHRNQKTQMACLL